MCLVALLATRQAGGQSPPRGPAGQVQALEDTLNAAWLRHDTLSLGRLIGADVRGITASGKSLVRADMLRAAARTEENATDYTDRTARAFGNVVVTTGRITDRGAARPASRSLSLPWSPSCGCGGRAAGNSWLGMSRSRGRDRGTRSRICLARDCY